MGSWEVGKFFPLLISVEDAARSDETVGIVSAVGIAVVTDASGGGGMYECDGAGFIDIYGHAYMPYPRVAGTASAEEKQVARPDFAGRHAYSLGVLRRR